jgi:hypothetical protein
MAPANSSFPGPAMSSFQLLIKKSYWQYILPYEITIFFKNTYHFTVTFPHLATLYHRTLPFHDKVSIRALFPNLHHSGLVGRL